MIDEATAFEISKFIISAKILLPYPNVNIGLFVENRVFICFFILLSVLCLGDNDVGKTMPLKGSFLFLLINKYFSTLCVGGMM